MLLACTIITILYWFSLDWGLQEGYPGVLVKTITMSAWLIFAVGCPNRMFHNKVIDYLSGISMEIYLSHMMSFRAVQFLHVSNYVHNMHICYWLTCLLTLAIAITFSHIVKYFLLPNINMLFCKKR